MTRPDLSPSVARDAQRLVLKVGSSLVTNEGKGIDLEAVTQWAEQIAGLIELRAGRDGSAVSAALEAVRRAAQGSTNLLHPMREALRSQATLGEICGVLRQEWGEYRPNVAI